MVEAGEHALEGLREPMEANRGVATRDRDVRAKTMNEFKSGNGRQKDVTGLSVGFRSASDSEVVRHAIVRTPHDLALNLDDIIYYIEQVLAGAIEIDSGFSARARDFTENCVIDAEAWLREWLAAQEESAKEVAEGRLVRLIELLTYLGQPDLTLEAVKEVAEAALSLVGSMREAGG